MLRRIFSNKEIVLGVTGSIAAYKACDIASRLVELGARVTPALTASATNLIGPASLEAITGRRSIVQMFEPFQNPEVEHIAVATKADLFLIAPATANILAKAAQGIADDWLSTTLLATRAPILFAPAMNSNMYSHPATQANIALLTERGCHFVGPGTGRLACKTAGIGRMIDTPTILEAALPLLSTRRELDGKHVLITSGGNREPIDPVRYIGNRSSGKMGRCLALEALARGARVTVVTGPGATPLPHGVEVIEVETAQQMADAVLPLSKKVHAIIGAAAVADYRVSTPFSAKHKRSGEGLSLALIENPDIIGAVGAAKRDGQVVVGFAAETDNLAKHGAEKLRRKNLDLIVANRVGAADSGFGSETTEALLITPSEVLELGLLSKEDLAARVLDAVAAALA